MADHCRALDVIIKKGKPGETYHIASGNGRTNLEVVNKLLELLNKPKSLIKFVSDRPGHDRRYSLDITKIAKELDWKPAHDFEEVLATTVDWYVKNESWWRKIKSGEYAKYYDRMYSGR